MFFKTLTWIYNQGWTESGKDELFALLSCPCFSFCYYGKCQNYRKGSFTYLPTSQALRAAAMEGAQLSQSTFPTQIKPREALQARFVLPLSL